MHKTQQTGMAAAVASDDVSAAAVSSVKASRFFNANTVALLLVFMASLAFGQDADGMTDGVVEEIAAIKTVLYAIGGAMISVGLVYAIYRFVRRFLG